MLRRKGRVAEEGYPWTPGKGARRTKEGDSGPGGRSRMRSDRRWPDSKEVSSVSTPSSGSSKAKVALGNLHIFILKANLQNQHNYPYLTGEETEAQREDMSCPGQQGPGPRPPGHLGSCGSPPRCSPAARCPRTGWCSSCGTSGS